MNDQEWKSSAPDVLASLSADAGGPSYAAKQRVARRLSEQLALGGDGAVQRRAELEEAPEPAHLSASTNGTRLRSLFGAPRAWTAAVAIAGAATAVGAYVVLRQAAAPESRLESSPRVSSLAGPVGSNALGAPAPLDPPSVDGAHFTAEQAPKAPDRPRDAPGVSAAPRASAHQTRVPADLGEQQKWLDAARRALSTGDGSAALRAIDVHRRRYRESLLSEERDAIAIKALAMQGRHGEARALAVRFAERYPQSMQLPSIRELMTANP